MTLLSVENLKTHYFVDRGTVKAVDGVSFTVDKGRAVGIAGESGCGKTTVALSLMRLVKGGEVVEGRITLGDTPLLETSNRELNRLRWERMSFVPQAAMGALNPVYRVGDQIVEAIRTHRQTGRRAAWQRAEEALEQVELAPSAAGRYPHELSGGMRQRAAIAMALVLDPELIIADEPTTALDVITQAGILRLLKRLQNERDLSILLISHDLSVLAQTCDQIMVMYAGLIMETAGVGALFDTPRHPYTRALLSSFPDLRQSRRRLAGLAGSPPDLLAPPRGCRFHPRCPTRTGTCVTEEPAMTNVGPEHFVRCLLPQ